MNTNYTCSFPQNILACQGFCEFTSWKCRSHAFHHLENSVWLTVKSIQNSNFGGKQKSLFAFFIIPQHIDDAGSWNSSECITRPMLFLLMSWRREEPGHQQVWHFPSNLLQNFIVATPGGLILHPHITLQNLHHVVLNNHRIYYHCWPWA